MATNELVGPLPPIRFHDGTVQGYRVPTSTLDPRYSLCSDHHPACDCREAMLAEDRSEYRSMLRGAEQAAAEVLAGHATWAWTAEGEVDWARRCSCTGCQIARIAHLRTSGEQDVPAYRPTDWEPPR